MASQKNISTTENTALNIPVGGIELDKAQLNLTSGEEVQLNATVSPSNASSTGVSWESSDSGVVEVSNGKITAKTTGNAVITAKTEGKDKDGKHISETCEVSVYDSKISISLGDTVTLKKDEKKTFDFIGLPDGYSINESTYTYSLSGIVEANTVIANGNATNTITANSVGETTITANITAKKTEEKDKKETETYYAICKVIVLDNSRINEESITLKVDETIALNTTEGLFLTIDNTPQTNENTTKNDNTNTVSSSSDENTVKVKWKSSDEKIVKVSDDAKLIPTGVGTTIVTASSSSPTGDGKCAVTVLPPFYLNKSVTTILLGGEETLRATLNLIDSNGVKIDWSIEDESCVELKDTSDTYTKIIKGTATGTAEITVSIQITNNNDTGTNSESQDKSNVISYSESCKVTVVSNHKEAIIKHVDNIIPQAKEQDNKGYSLDITFRTSTETDKPKEESKTLNLGVAKQFAIDEKAISVMLSSVRLHKEMYKPGCLELVLETTASLKDFTGLVTLKYKQDDDKQDTVASTYYIFEKKKKGDYVTLVAYSVDKFLTIDKFCQAFTGKTLVTDIVEKTLSSNNSGNNIRFFCNYITKAATSNYTTTKELRHLCVNTNETYYKKDSHIITQGQYNDLEEDDKKSYTEYTTSETILPYSVQYNESFYDFLVRLCNRNGEFLFVEDNQLHIGTPINDSPLDITSGYDSQSKISTDYEIEETECYCNGESDGFFLNCSETITPNSVSTSNKETTSSNSCFSSNERIYPEEYLTKTTKHEDDNYVELDEFMRAMDHVSSAIKSLTNCHTVYEALVDFGINEAWNAGAAKCNQNKVNQKYKEEYGNGGEYEFSFNKLLLNSSFYKNISTNGEKAANKKLVVTCSTYKNHKLGDTLEINGTNYVVCGVRSGVKLIDGAIKSENITRYKEYFEMELLPYINIENQNAKPYPIPLKELRIRKATAQRAKVTNNFDPERLGRVRVRYPWQSEDDKDDNDTPWIRISYPMASGEAGFMFTPDENDEVLVDYEDGNIEHPYIIGSFYNADNKPSPNANSYDNSTKTISSTNGHHISFNDTPPDVFVPNMLPGIISTLGKFGLYNDTKLMNLDKSLGGGFEIADLNGFYRIQGSTDERNITISSPIGDIKLDAYTGISISAPNGDVNIEGKNVKITARNNLTLESGVNIDSPYFWSRGKGKEIGTSFLEYAGNRAVSEVIDLSLMRVWFETISRPIGGTMLLKSHRFMRLEAGKGETKIVKQRLRDNAGESALGFFFNVSGNSLNLIFNNLKKYIKLIKECIVDIEQARGTSRDAQNGKLEDLIDANNFNAYATGNNRDANITYKNPNPTDENKNKIKGLYDAYQNIKNKKAEIDAITLTNATQRLFNADFGTINDFLGSPYQKLIGTNPITATTIKDDNLKKGLWEEFRNDKELKKCLSFDTNPAQPSSNSFNINGTTYDIKVEPRKRDKAANILQYIQKYAFDNTSGLMDDKVWSKYDTGNLLISNEENHTYHLEKDGTFKKEQNGVGGFAKTLKDIITNATI